jgi:NAD(P)-dependent dehydrogenase (short-subunit alcohol dehydrogenase family)
LAAHSATVVLVDIDEDAAAKVANAIDGDIVVKRVDINSEPDVEALFESVVSHFGSVDILVNSAYPRNKNYGEQYENVSLSDWQENILLNLNSYYLTCKKASEIMKQQESGGSIINLGSIYGAQAPDFNVYSGTEMTSPVEYAAIKGAIINFTRYLASYLGEDGIRANVLSPGGVFNNQDDTFVEQYEANTPLSRMAEPTDLKGPVVFLSADCSRYMTGQNLIIDGGWTIK